jgi:hypothetical protein
LKVSGVSSYRWTILLLATLVQVGVSILQQAPAALGWEPASPLVTVLLFALFYRELPEVVDEGADSYPPLGSIVRDRGFLATTGYAFVLMGVRGSAASYLALSLHEEVGLSVVAAAMGASLTIAFVGMFLTSPLFGLAADLTGSYGASWLGLVGWTVVGIALGFLARKPHEGAKP